MMDTVLDFSKILIADLILSGDNALVIGMAAAGLSPGLRKRAILYGMIIAALLRILFAVMATELWTFRVCCSSDRCCCSGSAGGCTGKSANRLTPAPRGDGHSQDPTAGYTGPARRTLLSALVSITLADVSMSLDNVLAVAAIAQGDATMLIFGLGLAILLMACAATLIMKLLTRYPVISWLGMAVLLYVAAEMLMRGFFDTDLGVGPILGLVDGWAVGGH